jgi:hypothetical protein
MDDWPAYQLIRRSKRRTSEKERVNKPRIVSWLYYWELRF